MRRPIVKTTCLSALACVAMAVAAVAPAAADSLTFIKNNNIWLANPDGSGQYQVTFDGTAASPYEYPSQSDAGTIVAIRRTAGQRPRIYRMSQSGRLLNAPINTPAPGTGAMDAKVSPNGALVAYWFETLVNDQLCSFCVSIANRALLSHSDRFTHHEAIGTPNTGGWPSWIGNDTIVVANGSAELWYYRLGTAAADEWFNDGVFIGAGAGLETLLDAEVAPAGDRLAVVRGNHQETIRFLELNGPPPAAPTPIAGCWFDQPSGRILNPTWTSDGEQIAWQEDDGVWLGNPGDLSCPLPAPELVIPGAGEPDLSPAAINPGPRPSCAQPGNPTICPPEEIVCAACERDERTLDRAALLGSLTGFARNAARALARLKVSGVLRKRTISITFHAPAAGTLAARLTTTGTSALRATVLATGRRVYTGAGNAKLTIKLTAQGRKRLRRARRVKATLKVSFTPGGARAISTTRQVRLKR